MAAKEASARHAIIEAFNRLVLDRRDPKPPVADVLDAAGVARSTFYDHFEGRDGLLIESLRAPLSIIADAAAGRGDEAKLRDLLDHFHDHRRGAADLLTGPLAPRLVRELAHSSGSGSNGCLQTPRFSSPTCSSDSSGSGRRVRRLARRTTSPRP